MSIDVITNIERKKFDSSNEVLEYFEQLFIGLVRSKRNQLVVTIDLVDDAPDPLRVDVGDEAEIKDAMR